ncbi:DUF397 domain-containing protein [Streptomyces pseudogriseolus]|uniref:DUF397 domain-containing protein n=1 Tax=Streptomyces pseudogriseolus TaxID=36817 RepID=UPI003FA33E5D
MSGLNWQKSSLCGSGDSCVHVAAGPAGIHITESADPRGTILTTTPDAFRVLLRSLKGEPHRTPEAPVLEVTTAGDGDTVRLRTSGAPGAPAVTTDRRRWDAFVQGVRAGEFDHFTV